MWAWSWEETPEENTFESILTSTCHETGWRQGNCMEKEGTEMEPYFTTMLYAGEKSTFHHPDLRVNQWSGKKTRELSCPDGPTKKHIVKKWMTSHAKHQQYSKKHSFIWWIYMDNVLIQLWGSPWQRWNCRPALWLNYHILLSAISVPFCISSRATWLFQQTLTSHEATHTKVI